MRAGWLADTIHRHLLRPEHATAVATAHAVPDRPLSQRIVAVQPANLFFHGHVHCFWAEFFFKQSCPTHARRCAAGVGKAGTTLPVTTGRIAAAWTMLLPLFAAFTARMGWLEADCKLKRGVRRYRRRSDRTQGDRLTPLRVVLDGVSSLFAAGLQSL